MSRMPCPHCGKLLANYEKLVWHLTRECPAMAASAKAEEGQNPASKPAAADR